MILIFAKEVHVRSGTGTTLQIMDRHMKSDEGLFWKSIQITSGSKLHAFCVVLWTL